MVTMLEPCVIGFSGVPLSGKTKTAEALIRRTNIVHLDVDAIRQLHYPNPGRVLLPEHRERFVMAACYTKLAEEALRIIDVGSPVVIIGTFSRPEFKAPLELLSRVLDEMGISLRIFLLTVSDEEVVRRIETRRREGSASNIDTLEKFQWAQQFFRPIEFVPVVKVDTSGKDSGRCAEEVMSHLSDCAVSGGTSRVP